MNTADIIRRATQTGIARCHRKEAAKVREQITRDLITAHAAGTWSWTKADAVVTDAHDDLCENYTIGPYTTAQFVKAINNECRQRCGSRSLPQRTGCSRRTRERRPRKTLGI